jgi:hypothetical protein
LIPCSAEILAEKAALYEQVTSLTSEKEKLRKVAEKLAKDIESKC